MNDRLNRFVVLLTFFAFLESISLAALGADAQTRRRKADELVGKGLRCIQSKHLVLYTDLEEAADVEELPHVFDLAIPQWCDFFQSAFARAR